MFFNIRLLSILFFFDFIYIKVVRKVVLILLRFILFLQKGQNMMKLSSDNQASRFSLISKNLNSNKKVSFASNENLKASYSSEFISKTASSSIGNISKVRIKSDKTMPAMRITFTGNTDKKSNQFLSIAPEMRGVAGGAVNAIYSNGGLGVVTDEASNNWANHYADKGSDVRIVLPLHTDNNAFGTSDYPGGLTVAKKGEGDKLNFIQVPADYALKDGEQFAVLNIGKKDGKDVANHAIIEDAGVKGSIKRVKEDFSGLEEIKYRLFKVQGSGQKNDKGKILPTVYLMHTPEISTFRKSYDLDAVKTGTVAPKNPGNSAYGGFTDLIYANFARAAHDAAPKLNEPAHGDFNPANIWLHDRQGFGFAVDAAESSANGNKYFNGLKTHSSYHNPGRNGYQGFYDNPLEFFRIVASEKDFNDLKASPDYDFVKQMYKKGEDGKKAHFAERQKNPSMDMFPAFRKLYTKEEADKLQEIFDPVIGGFKDDLGTYNMCMIPVQSVRQNPDNSSLGTVSRNYGKEMSSFDTPEIAEGMTKTFANVQRIDVTNGSTPANMKTGEVGLFGQKDNGFNKPEVSSGYTPYTPKLDKAANKVLNIDDVYAAKQKNKIWAINTIAKATQEGKLPELFYSGKQIEEGSTVLGGLSNYQEGDKLFFGWGRPDPQKNLPTSLEAFLHFYQRKDVSQEDKLKVKFVACAGPYPDDNSDWKIIKEQMKKLETLEGGAFKNNVCFINGRFDSRLANASDFTIFTSRYEPCGITPLESAAAGTPSISIKTGGSPDFMKHYEGGDIKDATGLLTKHAYLVKAEVIGADAALKGGALDEARRMASAADLSDLVKTASEIIADPVKHKKIEENQFLLEIDWHNNNAFNEGKSANEKYLGEAFGLDKDLKFNQARDNKPLKNLKGKFKEVVADIKEAAKDAVDKAKDSAKDAVDKAKDGEKSFFSTTGGKVTIAAVIGAVLLGIGYYMFANKNNTTQKQS